MTEKTIEVPLARQFIRANLQQLAEQIREKVGPEANELDAEILMDIGNRHCKTMSDITLDPTMITELLPFLMGSDDRVQTAWDFVLYKKIDDASTSRNDDEDPVVTHNELQNWPFSRVIHDVALNLLIRQISNLMWQVHNKYKNVDEFSNKLLAY